jgi:hypothetical protein
VLVMAGALMAPKTKAGLFAVIRRDSPDGGPVGPGLARKHGYIAGRCGRQWHNPSEWMGSSLRRVLTLVLLRVLRAASVVAYPDLAPGQTG